MNTSQIPCTRTDTLSFPEETCGMSCTIGIASLEVLAPFWSKPSMKIWTHPFKLHGEVPFEKTSRVIEDSSLVRAYLSPFWACLQWLGAVCIEFWFSYSFLWELVLAQPSSPFSQGLSSECRTPPPGHLSVPLLREAPRHRFCIMLSEFTKKCNIASYITWLQSPSELITTSVLVSTHRQDTTWNEMYCCWPHGWWCFATAIVCFPLPPSFSFCLFPTPFSTALHLLPLSPLPLPQRLGHYWPLIPLHLFSLLHFRVRVYHVPFTIHTALSSALCLTGYYPHPVFSLIPLFLFWLAPFLSPLAPMPPLSDTLCYLSHSLLSVSPSLSSLCFCPPFAPPFAPFLLSLFLSFCLPVCQFFFLSVFLVRGSQNTFSIW